MAAFNSVVLVGNLTRDPELRQAGSSQVCEIGLAVNENYKNRAGEKVEKCHFFDVVFWNKTAEVVCEYLHKGSSILVRGKLTQDTWTDKDSGVKRSKVKVTAQEMQMLGSKQSSQPRDEGPPDTQWKDIDDPPSQDPPAGSEGEDVPF